MHEPRSQFKGSLAPGRQSALYHKFLLTQIFHQNFEFKKSDNRLKSYDIFQSIHQARMTGVPTTDEILIPILSSMAPILTDGGEGDWAQPGSYHSGMFSLYPQ